VAFARAKTKLMSEAALYEYAVGALGRRMRSVAEMRRLLRNRVEMDTELARRWWTWWWCGSRTRGI